MYQENKTARSYLEKAIQIDPGFAEAYAALAWTDLALGEFRWQPPMEAYPPAMQAVRKALELDPNNCAAHQALAYLAQRYDWDWTAADRERLRLLELCPNSFRSHVNSAGYMAWNRRGADALAEIAKCRELDPVHSEPLWQEAFVYYHLRNYEALTEVSRPFTVSRPNTWLSHYWLGVAFEGSGKTLQAIPEYQKAVELSQGDQDPTAALAHAYAAIGKKPEAQKILQEFLRQSETQYISPYMIAAVYADQETKTRHSSTSKEPTKKNPPTFRTF